MSFPVILLATLETKAEQADYLRRALEQRGTSVEMVDTSLGSQGQVWNADAKLNRMDQVVKKITAMILASNHQTKVVVGLGGGTGGEIALRILQKLPMDIDKVLVTTLPFDPRNAVADTAITLIPTLADIEALNYVLCRALDSSAAIVAGLAAQNWQARALTPSIALTTLGATKAAGEKIISHLHRFGHEITSFHANGFGGAAFSRLTSENMFYGVIDMTVSEIVRMHVAGAHAPMANRFTCAGHIPRIVLPGGINFLDPGHHDLMTPEWLSRQHYRHSGLFTHVKLSESEMRHVAQQLANALNQSTAPCELILPMGGFSHQDSPNGAIEDEALRQTAAEIFERQAQAFTVTRLPHHILAPETAKVAVERLLYHLPKRT